MTITELECKLRDTTKGKCHNRRLRKAGYIPAVVYGSNQEPINFSCESKELSNLFLSGLLLSHKVKLKFDGQEEEALVREFSADNFRDILEHVAFQRLPDKNQTIKIKVLVYFNGREACIGVKKGGVFIVLNRFIEVECPAASSFRAIMVDISDLAVAASVYARDIKLPEGVKLMSKENMVIAKIIGRKGKSAEAEGESESVAGA